MEPALVIQNLTKTFGKKKAVDSLVLTIPKGCLFSLLGVNGAGKTTTIRMLTGLSKPTAGEAFLLGRSIRTELPEVKKRLGLSPQETAVAPNLTVFENLQLMAEIYGFKPRDARERTQKTLSRFSLEEVQNTRVKLLSGGYQRRLSIAMAMVTEPEILFLDEPTLGLDVLARRELWTLIRSLKEKTTIFMTTHYMEEAEALSDLVAVMVDGTIRKTGTPDALIRETGTKNLEEAFIQIAGGDGK